MCDGIYCLVWRKWLFSVRATYTIDLESDALLIKMYIELILRGYEHFEFPLYAVIPKGNIF